MIMQQVNLALEKAAIFTIEATLQDFIAIWGEETGNYLWGKFVEVYSFDFLFFFNNLDKNNKLTISKHIAAIDSQ